MRALRAAAATASAALLTAWAPAGAQAALQRVFTRGIGPNANDAITRTPDGTLHIMYQTTSGASPAPDGLATRTVSKSGKLSAPVQALSGWNMSLPGLAAPSGAGLLAAFGAVSPAQVSSMWTISSSDGGLTWSAPSAVPTTTSQAYGAALNLQALGSTPIFTLAVSGGVNTQQGVTQNAPSSLLTDSTDNFAGDVNSAVDPVSNSVYVSWYSLAGSGGDYIRPAAPTVGSTVRVPGKVKNEVQIASRTGKGGIYAPYTTDGTSVRLFRYGGGSVRVGSFKGIAANSLGVAAAPAGRLWVMWGDETGIAVTRSNMALTRFEPIQHFNPGSFTLYRIYGDGQPGPLDLFVDQIPKSDASSPGGFYTRVRPVLSVGRSVAIHHSKTGAVTGYSVKVAVRDAGDAVSGAKVKLGARAGRTSKRGIVRFTFGAGAGSLPMTVTAATYRPYAGHLKL